MTQGHINAAFDEDLEALDALIAKMGNLALSQYIAVIDGLSDENSDLHSLIANDKKIDQLETEIYNKTVEIIAIENLKITRTLSILTNIDSHRSKAFDLFYEQLWLLKKL